MSKNRKKAIRNIYSDCTEMVDIWKDSDDRFQQGVVVQARVTLADLTLFLGEDYDYGS